MCGKPAGVVGNYYTRMLCEVCEAHGAGWTVVFDRDAGVGKIPENLLKEYGNAH